jgi:hypothetical protein
VCNVVSSLLATTITELDLRGDYGFRRPHDATDDTPGRRVVLSRQRAYDGVLESDDERGQSGQMGESRAFK